MRKPLQLQIPTPCHEQWADMTPSEKGRHCAACQKTVVDFTGMSDPEIMRYLAQAGTHVCGRLAPDQVNRNLALVPPPQRNGWSGWRWLLAGLLMTSNDQGHHRPAGPGIHEHRIPPKADYSEEFVMGMLMMPLIVDTARVDSAVLSSIVTTDTDEAIMGDISVTVMGSVPGAGDSIQGPPLVSKADSTCEPAESLAFLGGIVITRNSPADSAKQFVTDTLAALHLLPKKELTVYPNPAARGTVIHLSWQTEPGTYQVALYSIAGALIQERVLEVSNQSQVDVWEIPTGMAAGIYIIRAIRPGQAGGYSGKLVVE